MALISATIFLCSRSVYLQISVASLCLLHPFFSRNSLTRSPNRCSVGISVPCDSSEDSVGLLWTGRGLRRTGLGVLSFFGKVCNGRPRANPQLNGFTTR